MHQPIQDTVRHRGVTDLCELAGGFLNRAVEGEIQSRLRFHDIPQAGKRRRYVARPSGGALSITSTRTESSAPTYFAGFFVGFGFSELTYS